MIRCQLDTELPLEELRISVAEKRELDEPIESNGSVTLSGLPEGDLHLWFLQDEERLGEIKINAAKSGELIRLEIRLVTGNAILLEEFRITGLTETSSPAPSSPTSPVDHTQTIDQTSDGETASSHCPAPGETFSRTGALTRVIDRDAFELQGDDRRLYTIYIGSATRLQEGSARLDYADLEEGMRVTVRGAVAAGAEGECSIGARQIVVQRR